MIARSTALLIKPNSSSAGAAVTFGDNIQKLSRGLGTSFLGAAVRKHLLFVADFKLDGPPFRYPDLR